MDLNFMVEFIADHIKEHGQSPSNREIGNAMGGRSPSVVSYALSKLERSGRITRERGVERSIVVIDRESAE